MSQHDFSIANQGFPSFRSDLNDGLQALASNSAGASAPSTTYAQQLWYDSTNNLLKMRNTDNDAWITLAYFDQTNDEWELRSAVVQAVDSSGVIIKTDDGTARLSVQDDGSVVLANTLKVNAITDASGGSAASINGYTPSASNMTGRNRIINGAMMIDQRNAGASVTPTHGQYTLDRWFNYQSVSSKYSIQQSSTAPAGFVNSFSVTSLSAYTPSGSEIFAIVQAIEGLNVADLGWGTSDAKTITLSFWVRSSLTGTFGGSIFNSGYNRSYPFTYTISSADTWEKKAVTIAGDTTGTWLKNNLDGMKVLISLGAGSSVSGTAGAWSGSLYFSATGATSVVGTSGATFYLTGVQLEVGSTASEFEHRLYPQELALCQRYFETSFDGAVSTGNTSNTGLESFGGYSGTTTAGYLGIHHVQYSVSKRAAPTITVYDLASPRNTGKVHRFQLGAGGDNNQSAAVVDNGIHGFNVYSSGTASRTGIAFQYSSSAEL